MINCAKDRKPKKYIKYTWKYNANLLYLAQAVAQYCRNMRRGTKRKQAVKSSRSLSCICLCGRFSASRTRISSPYASEIWAQLTKNHLTKTSTERFREYIVFCKWCSLLFIVSFLKKKAMARIVEHIAKVAAVDRKKQNQPTSVISNIFLVWLTNRKNL